MERNNLLFGLTPEITTFAPVAHSFAALEKGEKNMLTDGVCGDPSDWYGGAWAHFYRGFGRVIKFDLGEAHAVCGFETAFIHERAAGIYCPEEIKLYLSEDGEDYYEACAAGTPCPASFTGRVRAVYSAAPAQAVNARFACFVFPVEINVFCDEIKLFEAEEGAPAVPAGSCGSRYSPDFPNRYELRDSLGGVYDMPLMYFGYWPENERVAKPKKADMLPYVAYIGRDGEIKDSMFDSMLMLPVQGRCPSGGSLSPHGEPSLLSDWEYVTDILFEKDCCLHALDEAVAEMKKALSLPDGYRFTVYLNAPTPKISRAAFGDVDGDGIEEKLLDDDDCVRAYTAYIDGVTRRFAASGMENIKIGGWFWTNEHMGRDYRDNEFEFAQRCTETIRSRGYKCLMIPYFSAAGADRAKSAGFDCVTMQPGLSFNETLQRDPKGVFEDFTALCRKYGFGVELEIHHGAKDVAHPETAKKYKDLYLYYLRACIENGMMTETVHTYYQAAGPGVFYDCAVSEDDGLREIYDLTYKFIKGTLTLADLPAENLSPAEQPQDEISGRPEETADNAAETSEETESGEAEPEITEFYDSDDAESTEELEILDGAEGESGAAPEHPVPGADVDGPVRITICSGAQTRTFETDRHTLERIIDGLAAISGIAEAAKLKELLHNDK